jgi:peptidoglycan/xylan/chitin deacetylase (PgdA/CDA1 family)
MRHYDPHLMKPLWCAALLCAMLTVFPGTTALAETPRRSVVLTFDDLPLVPPADLAATQRVTEALLCVLREHRAPAAGFVNEEKVQIPGEIDERIALLEHWLDAGAVLGNHTYSHSNLRETPLAAYEDDVIHGEVITRRLLAGRGISPLYFRYPYTNTGPTKEVKESFEAFLLSRGYTNAPFTVEHADYIYNLLWLDARARGDAEGALRVRQAYLEHLDRAFAFFEELARDSFGREIPQILLIHANEINADCLDEMLERLEARGYAFVSLEDALLDPAYGTPDEYVGRNGPSWLHRWRVSLGLPSRLRDEPDPPDWALQAYQGLLRQP